MKRKFIVLSALWLLFSCSGKIVSPIVGKWKLLEVNSEDMTKEEKNALPGNVIIEFTRDGKCITHLPDTSIAGSYTFNGKDSTLLMLNTMNGERFDCRVLLMGDLMQIVHPENSARLKRL